MMPACLISVEATLGNQWVSGLVSSWVGGLVGWRVSDSAICRPTDVSELARDDRPADDPVLLGFDERLPPTGECHLQLHQQPRHPRTRLRNGRVRVCSSAAARTTSTRGLTATAGPYASRYIIALAGQRLGEILQGTTDVWGVGRGVWGVGCGVGGVGCGVWGVGCGVRVAIVRRASEVQRPWYSTPPPET